MAGRPSSPELTNEEVFGPTKGDPTETYIELLRRAETDMESAEWLARKLGQNQDSARAFIHINRLAHDPSLEIRRLGVIAMAYCHSFGNRDASKYVQHLMNDPDESTRAVLAEGLRHADVFHHKICDDVEKMSHDESVKVRAAVADGLYGCGKEKCDRALARLLNDHDAKVREAAAGHLPYFDERKENHLTPEDILPCVQDSSPEVRVLVSPWLSNQPLDIALPHLLRLSRDPELSVRRSALAGLSQLQHPDALQALLDALKDKLAGIREEASGALRSVPGAEIGKALLALATDPAPRVRRHVAQGLVDRAEPDMLPSLCKLANDRADAHTRFQAAKALAKLPGPEPEAILAKLLNDPTGQVRKVARKLLQERGLDSPLPGPIACEVKYSMEEVSTCRNAFLKAGGGARNSEAWTKFLGRVTPFEGISSGSTEALPSMVFSTNTNAMVGLMPFGPVHWIAITVVLPKGGRGRPRAPRIDFRILGAKEISPWIKSQGIDQLRKGDSLAQEFGWI